MIMIGFELDQEKIIFVIQVISMINVKINLLNYYNIKIVNFVMLIIIIQLYKKMVCFLEIYN